MDASNTLRFAQAFVRTLIDSRDTAELLVGEELTSVGRMQALIPMMEASAEGRDILAERPRIDAQTIVRDRLGDLSAGTLGRAWLEHLDKNNLDPGALTVPVSRGPTELANYLLERVRQTHDLWHTLLGLGTAPHEEVLVHAFQWPQLRMPYSALIVGFGTVKHVIGEGRWALLSRGLRRALRAGRRASPLLPVYWERYWEVPVVELRRRLGIEAAEHWT